jgi:hypothetical protein
MDEKCIAFLRNSISGKYTHVKCYHEELLFSIYFNIQNIRIFHSLGVIGHPHFLAVASIRS